MGANRKIQGGTGKPQNQKNMNELLKFGPEASPQKQVDGRINKIVKKLQEITKRIDRISQQY